MKKRRVQARVLRVIILCSLLAAMSIALKQLSINLGSDIRIGFENLPIIFAGVTCGPIAGACVGVVADIVGGVAIYGSIIPGITVGACVIGLVSGLAYYIGKINHFPLILQVVIADASAHIIGSLLVKTAVLSHQYGNPFFILLATRSLTYLIVMIFETALIYILLRNKMVSGGLDRLVGNKQKRGKRG